jgi:hypothetical protein
MARSKGDSSASKENHEIVGVSSSQSSSDSRVTSSIYNKGWSLRLPSGCHLCDCESTVVFHGRIGCHYDETFSNDDYTSAGFDFFVFPEPSLRRFFVADGERFCADLLDVTLLSTYLEEEMPPRIHLLLA